MTADEINTIRGQTLRLATALRGADRIADNLWSACQWLNNPASDPEAVSAAEAGKAFIASIKAIVDETP
jgi:hypothetical protein